MQNPTKIPQATKRVLATMERSVENNPKVDDLQRNVMQGNRSIRDAVRRSPANVPSPSNLGSKANYLLRRMKR